LQLLELERERAREKREAQERARKAALEGTSTEHNPRPLLPFEDFDVKATITPDAGGTPVIRRSLTAGPGEYELTVAWVDPEARDLAASVRVVRRSLVLPPASTTEFALSSVIVADDVGVRETPVPPAEQAGRPYSIGSTEITPARDHVLTPDERLALVVQVINPSSGATGKPDVAVGFRVFRRSGAGEESIGTLAPQIYNEITLPADFDVGKGHPIFAAVGVPLRTFKRGDYRIEIAANDRVAGTGTATNVTFTVAATPAVLLREAPPLGPPFDATRESLPTTPQVLLGALRASEGNDREAVAVWEAAVASGADASALRPLILDALLRQGQAERVIALSREALERSPDDRRLSRQQAAACIAANRHADALRVLDGLLKSDPEDVQAQWLAMHALFAGFVGASGPGADAAGRTRLAELAERYIAAKGPHASLAREWANAVR
jgi:hypothetical protein